MSTWLAVDANYLCHRAQHTTGTLDNGVIFGFLRDITTFCQRYDTQHIIFCFDYGRCKRYDDYPLYKHRRQEQRAKQGPIEQANYDDMRRQIKALATDVLRRIGFLNVWYAQGYEADDLLAAVCLDPPRDADIVVVSADHDLYQLLRPGVVVYHPSQSKTVTIDTFRDTHGIAPEQWVQVKALAGCTSDDIPGCPGVGVDTAVRYVRGDLCKGKRRDAIEDNAGNWRRFTKLVELPYPGTPIPRYERDVVTDDNWNAVVRELGMPNLLRGRQGKVRQGFGYGTG